MNGPVERGHARRRIHLVRHGEVAYFDPDGRPVNPRDVRLTERGASQARAVAELLESEPIDRAVASGLPRTRETAALVLGGRDIEIEDEAEFAEIRGGRFADVDPEEAIGAIAYPYDGASSGAAWFGHGEGFADFEVRVLGVLRRLVAAPGWRRLLLVGHDAVNRVVLCWAAGVDLRAMKAFEQDYGGLSIVDVDIEEATGEVRRRFLRAANLTPLDPAKREGWQTSMEPVYERYLEARKKGHL